MEISEIFKLRNHRKPLGHRISQESENYIASLLVSK